MASEKANTAETKTALGRRFEEMTDAAARLIESSINAADPDDPKILKAITGALKDLKELMESPPGASGGDIVIRVEGGAPRPPDELPSGERKTEAKKRRVEGDAAKNAESGE